MALTSGTKLGPYEILSQLGAGGMGEVYRARDTRLDRTVALKVLPAAFSADADRLHRFQYEARILSTLNHPNVVAIYDVGEQNGIRYLVSEFLDGQTLRDKLAAGSLSRFRISEHALEIAKGLAAAHEKGVVHRDLKPDNIFVTSDDRVKVLDFGLAKQAVADTGHDGATMTGTNPTTPGTVMGTVGYMSPEQVRGQVLDHRSDIFSFGAVLYEMASGKRAFRGDSSVETMNAILKEDVPELSESGPQVSPGLDRIVRRCLEKKPERRFQSASDLAFALEALSGSSSVARPSAAISAAVPVAKTNGRMWIAGALVALAVAAAAIWFYPRTNSFPGTFTQMTFRSAYIRNARFAAGKTIVYGASVNGQPMQIISTRTDTFESQPLNIQADMLGISPNSDVAVSLDRNFDTLWVPRGRLAKAPLGGGATRELLDDVTDADWNKDGSDLAIARRVDGQFRLEYPPGKVLYQTTGYISDLRFSPSGKEIAFLDHPVFGDDRGNVSLVDLEGHRRILAGDYSSEQGLAWSSNGNEVWYTANVNGEPGSLRAVDLRGRTRVILAAPIRMHLQDISPDGRVLLSAELLRWQVGIADKNGLQRDMTAFQWPEVVAISADGNIILLNSFDISLDANYRLYVQRTTDGSLPVQIGEGSGSSLSVDAKWVAAIDPTNPKTLLVIPTGVGETRTLHAPEGRHYLGASLLPDNQRILISTAGSTGTAQAGLQDIATGEVHPVSTDGRFIPTTVGLMLPGVSLDGKLCLVTDGKQQYWLQPLDGSAAREVHGISPGDLILQWHGNSDNVFVSRPSGSDTEVYTVNLMSGERKLWTRFTPADKTAVAGHGYVIITPDGAHYAYTVQRIYSTLFLADGLR